MSYIIEGVVPYKNPKCSIGMSARYCSICESFSGNGNVSIRREGRKKPKITHCLRKSGMTYVRQYCWLVRSLCRFVRFLCWHVKSLCWLVTYSFVKKILKRPVGHFGHLRQSINTFAKIYNNGYNITLIEKKNYQFFENETIHICKMWIPSPKFG